MHFFDSNDYYTGAPITIEAIRQAENRLGLKLPRTYTNLLAERNGGRPIARCFPTSFSTSWASDHFAIDAILGVGGDWGVDNPETGSQYMIAEWNYPDVGVVVCITPSGGHDTVMLDYSECGRDAEPTVVYVDEDRIPRRIAASFADFIAGLIVCASSVGQ